MASSFSSCSNTNATQRKHFPLERRPRMLKDFLLDDSNSCSSNGFKSFPRIACQDCSSNRNLIQIDLNSGHAKPNYAQRLQRSRSKAASTTISAFKAMINAVKRIHFMTSPSILPRSLTRKLSTRNSRLDFENKESEIKITVRVKDIIRWKSFRDLVEEKSRPSYFASSPHGCTTITTAGSTCTPCRSSGSSWCDSDFTREYLLTKEYGENEVEVGKKFLPCVGKDPMETTTELTANQTVGPKVSKYNLVHLDFGSDEFSLVGYLGIHANHLHLFNGSDLSGRKYASEEKEQHSPLSVLDFEYEEDDEDSFSSVNQSLAVMERTKLKLTPKIRRFESLAKWMSLEEAGDDVEEEEETNEVEQKARLLLNHVKETSSLKSYSNISTDKLVLDLFREELTTEWNHSQTRNADLENVMVKLAKAWINGEQNETAKWGVGEKKEACVRDMDREGRWSKFEEEQEELAWEVERGVMSILVDELLVDLLQF
ncbi:uncharacterized protein LOC111306360 [Durio zibethinus]|uniref:Uncharacterized protein LOC111306360 n=1 Tax=Durio zibethinus TaxID=66656 RepID=A0A6P6A5I5_DURZI|nr:uncharacterized protein LOC111306360 [Durio zibethinus]